MREGVREERLRPCFCRFSTCLSSLNFFSQCTRHRVLKKSKDIYNKTDQFFSRVLTCKGRVFRCLRVIVRRDKVSRDVSCGSAVCVFMRNVGVRRSDSAIKFPNPRLQPVKFGYLLVEL